MLLSGSIFRGPDDMGSATNDETKGRHKLKE
jgi:hypothetical protein